MPELPEVETIRRDLIKKIVGRKIKNIEVKDKKIGEAKDFACFLVNKNFTDIERVGKLLAFRISSGSFLLVHLKMTGQLVFEDKSGLIAGGHSTADNFLLYKYTRFQITFFGDGNLFFNDLRRFGYVKIVSVKEWEAIKNSYGIEPLQKNFTLKNLKEALQGKRNIKAVLLDQKNIAGIGNIYADEILFAAKIKPARPAFSLKKSEIEKIYKEARRIISLAIKYRGTTFSDYVDASGKKGNYSSFLLVYGRTGQECYIC
ncbi:MAG: bifunctional DNA-formamidopyrimidine glycosylase/DNA-(apurinic or apyrimidinic site) lyase, partial [Patescibacteria group bacterium]